MDFNDLRPKRDVQKKLIKTDWSAEEAAFKANLAAFHADIEVANFELEICAPEAPKENTGKPKEGAPQSVELVNVPQNLNVRAPDEGVPVPQPAQPVQPKEKYLPTEDDVFGDCTPASQKDVFGEHAVTNTPAKSPAPVESADDIFGDDDFFGESPKKSAPAPEPKQAPKPAPAAPAPTPAPAAVEAKVEAEKADEPDPFVEPIESKESPVHALADEDLTDEELVARGINIQGYRDMMMVVNGMLVKVPEVNIEHLLATQSEYAADIDFDHTREDPQTLSKKIHELAAKRESVGTQLKWIKPNVVAMKHAIEWIKDIGPTLSSAKNAEKRTAEIKLLTWKFWQRHALLDRLHKDYESTYDHLTRQLEAVSRLVTCEQHKLEYIKLQRGGLVEEVGSTPPWETQIPHTVSPAVLNEKEEEEGLSEKAHDEQHNRMMSQPLDPKKFSDCQAFPENPPKVTGKNKFKKGEIDW
jgi:hypothetical protein